jgi:hypothetical protein
MLMRFLALVTLVLGAASLAGPAEAQTAVSVDARIGDFHVAISNYYRVPEREVIVIRERHIRDEELPVVLFIAQRAAVAPATIVDLRLRGLSWWDISVRYGLGPEAYYVPVAVVPGPPYGRAHGHYKKPRTQWHTIVLSDDEIVHLVQVRFLSDYYRVAPERVIEVRGSGRDVVAVHHAVSRGSRHDRDGGAGASGRGRGQEKARSR